MAKYKFKKGVSIGALAAEHDSLLKDVFVDAGYLDKLCDAEDSRFLILGRAGSGKTALVRKMQETQGTKHLVQIDPEELSMQYLQNSVLREISTWGVNLEIFYKYLWRHVFVLALVRARFGEPSSMPQKLTALTGLREMFFGESGAIRDTQAAATSYMQSYSDQFWVGTDTKIQKITAEMEEQLKADRSLSLHLGNSSMGLGGKIGAEAGTKSTSKVEQETVARAQEIVSRFQIAHLNRVVDLVTKHAFEDEQNPFFLVVDDLDKNWMPDDTLYLELLKSLLLVVRELNYRLKNAKIVVALREDIYQRVYERTGKHEAQREKWSDVQLKVRWDRDQLVETINRRLAEVYRGQYTQDPPTLGDLLPLKRRKPHEEEAIDYILDRTLMRPRDLIDFVNRCIAESSDLSRMTWADLRSAEVGYSEARLKAIVDEWANCYFGLAATFPLLLRLGERFTPGEISDDDLLEIFLDDATNDSDWLRRASGKYDRGGEGIIDAKAEILQAWFNSGLVGIKDPMSHQIVLSLDRAFIPRKDSDVNRDYIILRMVRFALGINTPEAS